MATLTVNEIALTGLDDSSVHGAAAAGGDAIPNTGREFVEVINGGASPCVVTITAQGSAHGQAYADSTVTVAAGGQKKIGPFSTLVFNDSNQLVQLSYDQVSSVTVAAFKLPLVPG